MIMTIVTSVVTLALCIWYGVFFVFKKYPENVSFLNSIPSFCTGVGVFFTFFVLFISLGLQYDGEFNVDVIIPKLVGAFSTSLIGVFSSLTYTVIIRRRIAKLEEEVSMDKPYLKVHPNELLHQIQEGIAILNSENNGLKGAINGLKSSNEAQISRLSHVIENLATNINEEIRETASQLRVQLGQFIEEIGSEAIRESRNSVTNINQEFLNQTESLIQNNHINLSQQFQSLESVFSNLIVEVGNLSNKMSEQTTATKEHFGSAVDNMVHGFEGQISDTINSTNNILQSNLDSLEKTFSNIEAWQLTSKQVLEEVTREFVKSVQEYKSIGKQNQAVLDEVKKQLEMLEILRENEASIIGSIGKYDEQLSESLNKMNDVYNAISKLGSIEARLAKLS